MTNTMSKIRSVNNIVSTASNAWSMAKDVKAKYDQYTTYTATVAQNAFVWEPMMEWLTEETKTRHTKFISRYSGIKRHYSDAAVSKVVLDGHSLRVDVEKPEIKAMMMEPDEDMSEHMGEVVTFYARSREGIDALEKHLDRLGEERRKAIRDIRVYTPSTYGWEGQFFPKRNLGSVFLPEGVKEGLLADLDTFLENKDHYTRIGIPWHRGYLFHGPPGNGKSSLAAAIAHEYKMNLYSLPLSAMKSDKALADSVAKISPKSILLLEDIDVFTDTVSREQKSDKESATLAGLLNALDGVATPSGLVTFMTTNHVENLDPALIRAGRMDYKLELLPPNQHQIESMFKHAFEEDLGVEPKEFASMADLADVFKRFPLDSESARMEIKGD